MSTDNEFSNEAENEPETAEDVAEGVTNEPRGTGDLDEDALRAGEDRLDQAGGGH
jgi:hypothetical protein